MSAVDDYRVLRCIELLVEGSELVPIGTDNACTRPVERGLWRIDVFDMGDVSGHVLGCNGVIDGDARAASRSPSTTGIALELRTSQFQA